MKKSLTTSMLLPENDSPVILHAANAKSSQKAALRSLWSAAFCEESTYTDFIMEHCLTLGNVLWDFQGNSMLTLFPITLQCPSSNHLSGYYAYGLATDPRSQGKGHASRLLEFASRKAASEKASFLLLFPASPQLGDYYMRRGFTRRVSVASPKIVHNGIFSSSNDSQTETVESIYRTYCQLVDPASYSFLWSKEMLEFALQECAIRGGFYREQALWYPHAMGWEVKPLGKSTKLPNEGLLKWISTDCSREYPAGLSFASSHFSLPLD